MEGMNGGLYIPGAKVPASCNKCYDIGLAHRLRDLGGHCPRMDLHYSPDEQSFKNDRRADCPLVDVPAHGRLIDADAAIEHLEFTMKHCAIEGHTAQRYMEMIVELSISPTVIPADVTDTSVGDKEEGEP